MQTMNKAIYKVLTTQFKKDCKDEIEMIENAGYEITKYNGVFHVKNPNTERSVWVKYGYSCTYIERVTNAHDTIAYNWNDEVKFDFVGYLNKPRNTVWREIENSEFCDYRTEGYFKRERLTFAKNRIKNRKNDVEKIKKEIAKLQNDLEKEITYMIRAEYELEKVRKELGLVKEG